MKLDGINTIVNEYQRMMQMKVVFIVAIALVILAAVACGTESEAPSPAASSTPESPTATAVESVPTARAIALPPRRPTPTAEPTAMPTSVATPAIVPTPIRMETSTPVPHSESTPLAMESPEPVAENRTSELPAGCLTDGSLMEPKLIASCSAEAMSKLRSFSAVVQLNLAAMLPGDLPPDAEVPRIRTQISVVYPRDYSVVTTGPQGEVAEYKSIDGVYYFYDTEGGGWVRFTDVPEEPEGVSSFMDLLEIQLQELDSPDIEWKEVTLSEDESRYIVSYLKEAEVTGAVGMEGFQPPTMELRMTVDAGTFVPYEASLLIPVSEGESRAFAEYRFSDHNSLLAIEPPAKYTDGNLSN